MKKLISFTLVLVLLCFVFAVSAETLRQGSKGETVRLVQEKLSSMRFYTGAIDGIYGKLVKEAVWRYQNEVGLTADGIAGPKTLASLGIASVSAPAVKGLTIGAKGTAVSSVQTALKNLGYYAGAVNGSYDYATWEAVWKYQRDKGYAATGVATSQTLSALGIGASGAPVIGGLSYGSTGSTVRSLQTVLKNLGYYKGSVDGVYSYNTFVAVWQYQFAKGMPADGIANSQVLSALGVGTVALSGASLSYGAKGEAVRILQTNLKNLGYYTVAVDGEYAYQTYLAVFNFQRDKGIPADGKAGPQTLNLLGLSNLLTPAGQVPTSKTLKYGARGDAVTALQTALTNLKYFSSSIDGKYGYSTYEAVWWFQNKNGLAVTGEADVKTIQLINSGYAISK